MPASIVARVVRMPVLAAVVVPMLAAACSNDPLSPTAQAPRANSRVSRVAQANVPVATGSPSTSDASLPWYRNSGSGNTSGSGTASTSDASLPWYRNSSGSASTSDASLPWY